MQAVGIRGYSDRLLVRGMQVGMQRKDAFKAMAEELHYGETTIRNICRKPYLTPEDLRRDGQKCFELALYSLLHELGSNSGPSSSS